MKINTSDLKAAFLFAAEQEFSDIPPEQSLNHTFSSKFVTWGNKFVTYRFPTKRITPIKRVVRAILIAAIIMALLVGTVMAFPAVREAVKKFFVRRDGNMQYIEFYVNQTTPTAGEVTDVTVSHPLGDDDSVESEATDSTSSNQSGPPIPIEYYFPAYLPEGLKVESEVVDPFTISTVMSSSNGLRCDYCQSLLPNGNNINAFIGLSGDYIHSEKTICDIQIDFFAGDAANTLIWTDEYYLYRIIVNADMPMEEIEKIISSIEPRDDLNNP